MAQHVDVITDKFKKYINQQLISLSKESPIIAVSKPLITRIIDNNMYKIELMLKQIADKDGLVDIDNILSEMIQNIMNTKMFKVNSGLLGELEIGGGKIKMNLPFFNKAVVFNQQDLLDFKEMLSK